MQRITYAQQERERATCQEIARQVLANIHNRQFAGLVLATTNWQIDPTPGGMARVTAVPDGLWSLTPDSPAASFLIYRHRRTGD